MWGKDMAVMGGQESPGRGNYISVSHWNEVTVPSALDPLSASSSGSRPSPGRSCLPGLFLILGVRDGVKPLVRQR